MKSYFKIAALLVLGGVLTVGSQIVYALATENTYQSTADSLVDVSNVMKSANSAAEQVLAFNAAHTLDWTSQAAEDALAGRDYSKEDVSNVLGSLSTFTASYYATNGVNFEKLAKPIP